MHAGALVCVGMHAGALVCARMRTGGFVRSGAWRLAGVPVVVLVDRQRRQRRLSVVSRCILCSTVGSNHRPSQHIALPTDGKHSQPKYSRSLLRYLLLHVLAVLDHPAQQARKPEWPI